MIVERDGAFGGLALNGCGTDDCGRGEDESEFAHGCLGKEP
jgi:hypothetical protein